MAGVPGLEPELTEPETVGLPITPYPMGNNEENYTAETKVTPPPPVPVWLGCGRVWGLPGVSERQSRQPRPPA